VNDTGSGSVVLFVGDGTRTMQAGRAVERAVPDATVSRAETEAAALAAASDDAVVCVVTAWTDGGVAGESFLAALRTRRPSVPIVVVTDVDLTKVGETVAEHGVADVRPRTPETLADELLARSVATLVCEERGGVDDRGTLHTRWYRRLVEQNIVGICVIEDRAFSYVNPRLAEIFQTTPVAMEGRPVMSFVTPEDRNKVRAHLEAQEEGCRGPTHYSFGGVCADGTRREVETSSSGIAVDGGVSIVGVVLDVTERERREREVRHLSRAVEHAAPAIYITDVEGTITYANPSFERITGHAVADAIGETPALLASGRMSDSYYDEMYRTINTGEVWREAIVDRRANGELYHARQTVAPIYDRERIDGFVAIQEDVTDERIQQQVLQVLHRILRHNLRNELNVISGHAEELSEQLVERDDDDGVTSVNAIKRATAKLRGLSDRATETEFTIESDENDRWAVDLRALLNQQWQRLPDGEATRLHVDGPETAPVTADSTLAVAVRELLRVTAGPAGGQTNPRVTLQHTDDEVELRLHLEEGVISEWDPVKMGGETPLEHASGLDTWLVEWVVTHLGGDLRLTEEADSSVLTVRLPSVGE
jgi:PAS domain S-box-containing protein